MSDFSIGTLSRKTGVKIPTIRYYESIGMLDEPGRSPGGQRRYDGAHLEQLRFIRHGRDLGFGLDDLRALQDLSRQPERSCEAADRIARQQLADVERRLAGLVAVKQALEGMIAQCSHGVMDDCRVIQTLSDHGLCDVEHSPDGQTPRKAG
ncbi:MerR family transcriptional regulator [Maricaulis sp. W15]|uniref:MerR family transcriptional regulator n=1 Tax=Maricaulis sp. W15 TaxID=1772333 RepID=UPI000948FDD5|nr:helix-turn-helix domain-containing protein [Maricaulis sp. W15]OLF71365.1 MerR family transcriptional regulator [Maricaulis sp. W15]